MKHNAHYLDNGFYIVSDAAAGALCSVIHRKLPPHGRQQFVMLDTGTHKLNAWLQRTDLRATMRTDVKCKRGWRWAIMGLRPDGPTVCNVSNPPITLGKAFRFEAIASTVTVAA